MRQWRSRRAQRGIGLLGLLFWLFLAVAVVTLALRLGPAYLQFMTVKSVMAGVSEDPDAAGAPPGRVLSMVRKRLDVNSVTGVTAGDFAFERAPSGGLNVSVDYEVRQHVAFNIDAVLAFEHTESIPPK